MAVHPALQALARDPGSKDAWTTFALDLGVLMAAVQMGEAEELLDGVARIGVEEADPIVKGVRRVILSFLSGYTQAVEQARARAIDDAELATMSQGTRAIATLLKARGALRHGDIATELGMDKGQLSRKLDAMVEDELIEDVSVEEHGSAKARLCRLLPRGERLALLPVVKAPTAAQAVSELDSHAYVLDSLDRANGPAEQADELLRGIDQTTRVLHVLEQKLRPLRPVLPSMPAVGPNFAAEPLHQQDVVDLPIAAFISPLKL